MRSNVKQNGNEVKQNEGLRNVLPAENSNFCVIPEYFILHC